MKLTKLLLLLSSSFLLAGCTLGQKDASNANNESGNSSQNSESTSEEQLGEEKTVEIEMNGNDWSADFHAGAGFADTGTTDNSSNRELLLEYLNQDADIFEAISTTGSVNSTAWGTLKAATSFTLGSGSNDGGISFTFKKTIKCVTLNLESYWQTYDSGTGYSGCYYDLISEFEFNVGSKTTGVDLRVNSTNPQDTSNESAKIQQTFNVGTKALSMNSVLNPRTSQEEDFKGRVMVHDMTIVYYE